MASSWIEGDEWQNRFRSSTNILNIIINFDDTSYPRLYEKLNY